MLLLAQAEPVTRIFSFPTTDGVTMALVLFQLAALLFPAVIKNRQQFFASFGVTLGIILLFTLRLMLYDTIGVQVFGGVVTGLLQIAALVLIFLSCGGMTVGQFANELKGSYEVIRRGGEEKEVV
ncbi:MAG TPA: hypothetical protein VK324_18210, partial [Tepidisphaeraceae bacterium]|nr:hypothetical protein [Tepidisphaeraceae bacterium]